MNLVDSSAWLEYLSDGKNAKHFTSVIEDTKNLIVSTINLYEIYKKVLSERDENSAIQVLGLMQQAKIIDVNSSIAVQSAKLSFEKKIPMADSIIYTTAKVNDAIVWTQDADFLRRSGFPKNLEGVKYFKKI